MSCACERYPHLTLDRNAISKRIKESKALKRLLKIVDENKVAGIALFQCPSCGETWQSGREWNVANQEYLFRVPPIKVDEWQKEPYMQPGAMMIYSATMRSFYERAKFACSEASCRIDNCSERALISSVFCEKHHIESLQKNGILAKPPVGKMFPPYYEEKPTR